MPSSIRILCVFATLDRGGAESMCMNIYRQIDRANVQFDFVKHTSVRGAYEDEIDSLGGRIYEAPRYKIINELQYKKWWRSFFREHPEYRIIHGHFFTISHVYFKVAHEFGLKTIGHSHSEKANYHSLKFWVKRHSVPWIEKESDYCFACSKAAGEYLFPHREFTVIHNAIDAQRFSWDPCLAKAVREELGIKEGSLVVGVCGRFSPQKNPVGILRIFKAIHERNRDTLLLWVGDGELRQQVEKEIRRIDIKDSVILTGVRSDVWRMMQAMDVFILPSLWEGLAVVSVEAQAAGLTCYFSDTVTKECAITNLVQFLPLENPELWAEMILTDGRKRINTFQKIVEAGYDIKSCAEWMERFYLDLYGNNGNYKG